MNWIQKSLCVVFLAALPMAAQSPATTQNLPEVSSPETYLIWNAVLLNEIEGMKKLSIVSTTTKGNSCEGTQVKDPDIKEALDDYLKKNETKYHLKAEFQLPIKYTMAEQMEQVGGVRPPPPGKSEMEFIQEQMKKLDQMQKEHYTQIELSMPGLSANGSTAVVYSGISFAGGLHVLRKKDGKWVLEKRMRLCYWIS